MHNSTSARLSIFRRSRPRVQRWSPSHNDWRQTSYIEASRKNRKLTAIATLPRSDHCQWTLCQRCRSPAMFPWQWCGTCAFEGNWPLGTANQRRPPSSTIHRRSVGQMPDSGHLTSFACRLDNEPVCLGRWHRQPLTQDYFVAIEYRFIQSRRAGTAWNTFLCSFLQQLG